MAALAVAMKEADPGSLGAAQRLRRDVDGDTAAWALSQASLRRKATAKFSRAAEMLFTPAGLEQSSREAVAKWRAQRFVDAGVEEVWDLGCGIGSDAMAFAAAGLRVVAVELDPETAAVAQHNLNLAGGGDVIVGAAEDVQVPEDAAVFLDPARRTAKGRTWRVADFTPAWDFVLGHLAGQRFACVKLGPGVPKELIPDGVQTNFVSHHGDVVEASLWRGLPEGSRAVLFPAAAPRGEGVLELGGGARAELEVRPVGRFVLEPDGAVIRARLLDAVAPEHDLWLLDDQVAYLSSDEALDSPYATAFEVLDVLPYDARTLRAWVRDNDIGTLEIKKRAIDVDPAELRRQLKPRGRNSATLLLARTVVGTRALVCRRMPPR